MCANGGGLASFCGDAGTISLNVVAHETSNPTNGP